MPGLFTRVGNIWYRVAELAARVNESWQLTGVSVSTWKLSQLISKTGSYWIHTPSLANTLSRCWTTNEFRPRIFQEMMDYKSVRRKAEKQPATTYIWRCRVSWRKRSHVDTCWIWDVGFPSSTFRTVLCYVGGCWGYIPNLGSICCFRAGPRCPHATRYCQWWTMMDRLNPEM